MCKKKEGLINLSQRLSVSVLAIFLCIRLSAQSSIDSSIKQQVYWLENSIDTNELFHDPNKQEVFNVLTAIYAVNQDSTTLDSCVFWSPIDLLESYCINLVLDGKLDRLEQILTKVEYDGWSNFPTFMIRGFSEWMSNQSPSVKKRFKKHRVFPIDPSIQLGSINRRRQSLLWVLEDRVRDERTLSDRLPIRAVAAYVKYYDIKAEEHNSSQDADINADFNLFRTTKLIQDSVEFWQRLLGSDTFGFDASILSRIEHVSESYRVYHSPIRYFATLSNHVMPIVQKQLHEGRQVYICGERELESFSKSRLPDFVQGVDFKQIEIKEGFVKRDIDSVLHVDGIKMVTSWNLHEFDWKSVSKTKQIKDSKKESASRVQNRGVELGLGYAQQELRPNLSKINADLSTNGYSNIKNLQLNGVSFWVKPDENEPLLMEFSWRTSSPLRSGTSNELLAPNLSFQYSNWELAYYYPALRRRFFDLGLGMQYNYAMAKFTMLDSFSQHIAKPTQDITHVSNNGHSLGINVHATLKLPLLYFRIHGGAQLDLSNPKWETESVYLNTESDFTHSAWYFGFSAGIRFEEGGNDED